MKMLTKDEFADALAAARQTAHGSLHPFSHAWAQGQFSREQLGRWAIQHFYYIDSIPQQFAALYSRVPDLEARRDLLDNLIGEEMPHAPGKRHPDLCVKFARACGMSDDDIYRAEQLGTVLPTTRAMRAWIWELSSLRTLAEAFSGIMVALEGQLPTLYPMLVTAMHKQGFNDDDLEFFHVHIVNDVAHEASGFEMANRYSYTPELQQKAIAAVRASTQMRYSMLSGIETALKASPAA